MGEIPLCRGENIRYGSKTPHPNCVASLDLMCDHGLVVTKVHGPFSVEVQLPHGVALVSGAQHSDSTTVCGML